MELDLEMSSKARATNRAMRSKVFMNHPPKAVGKYLLTIDEFVGQGKNK
jgi:hypothetical protein